MLRSGLLRGHVGVGKEDELINNLGDKHLLGKIGTPENVADIV